MAPQSEEGRGVPGPVLALLATRFALSISPVHLLLPVAEVQLETRLTENLSLSAIAGVGAVSAGERATRYAVWELGAQVRHYPWIEGFHVGLEALAIRVDGQTETVLMSDGIGVGGLVGYQWMLERFVFEVNGGLGVRYRRSEARDFVGILSKEEVGLWPILNLNVGRAF